MEARDVGIAAGQCTEALAAARNETSPTNPSGRAQWSQRALSSRSWLATTHQPAAGSARGALRAEVDLERGLPQPTHRPGIRGHELLAGRGEPGAPAPLQLDQRHAQRAADSLEQAPGGAVREPDLLRRSTERRVGSDRREQRGEPAVNGGAA